MRPGPDARVLGDRAPGHSRLFAGPSRHLPRSSPADDHSRFPPNHCRPGVEPSPQHLTYVTPQTPEATAKEWAAEGASVGKLSGPEAIFCLLTLPVCLAATGWSPGCLRASVPDWAQPSRRRSPPSARRRPISKRPSRTSGGRGYRRPPRPADPGRTTRRALLLPGPSPSGPRTTAHGGSRRRRCGPRPATPDRSARGSTVRLQSVPDLFLELPYRLIRPGRHGAIRLLGQVCWLESHTFVGMGARMGPACSGGTRQARTSLVTEIIEQLFPSTSLGTTEKGKSP